MRGPAVRTAYPSRRLQAAAAAAEITEEVDLADIVDVVDPPASGFRSSAPAQQAMPAAPPSSGESLVGVHERATVRPPPMLGVGAGAGAGAAAAIEPDPPTLLTKLPRHLADEYFDADEVIEDQATEVAEDQLTRVRKPVSLSLPQPPPVQVRTPSGHSISNQRVAFPAPQFSAPLQPKPFVPVLPITQPTLVDQDHVETPQQLSRPKLPTPATLTEVPAAESLASVPAQALPPTVRRSPTPSAWKIDVSSIAPVAMPIGGHSRMADRTIQLRPKKRSAAMTFFLIVIGLLIGGAAGVLAIVPGAYGRARTVASGYVDQIVGARPKTEPTVSIPLAPPPAPAPMPVPPAMLDTRPVIESDMTLVTLPPAAKGHRVYVDGKLMPFTGEPLKLKCGMHTIRTFGTKTKTVELPCGRDVILAD